MRHLWVVCLLALSACASGPPRPDWTRGPLTDSSLEFKRDHYQCRQESRVLVYPPAATPDPYQRPGFARGFAAGASVGAQARAEREAKGLYKDCLRARGWVETD